MLQEHLVLDSSSRSKAEEYVRCGLRIALWAQADPEHITEDQVRAFFLELKREGRYAPNTVRLMTAALRFLFTKVLGRVGWAVFGLIRSPEVQRLPIVLSEGQAHALLAHTRLPHFLMLWELILGTGLRISEAVSLEVTAVRGKGEAAQHAMAIIREEAGLPEVTTCHTLRHTYATMSLEAGVNLLQVSRYLGHESLETTQIYLHVTLGSEQKAVAAIEQNLSRLFKPQPPV